MAQKSTMWKFWAGFSLLGLVAISLAAAWWSADQARIRQTEALRAQLQAFKDQPGDDEIRSENSDLVQFIDEAYSLLNDEGFHIQLDLEQDPQGRYRLKADSAKLSAELKAKLRELEGADNEAPPDE